MKYNDHSWVLVLVLEIRKCLQFFVEFLIEGLYVLLAVIFEQAHRKFVFFLMAGTTVSFDGAVELNDCSFESCDLILVGAGTLVGFQISVLEVFREFLVPVDIHLNKIPIYQLQVMTIWILVCLAKYSKR